jgi:hypothetical protein
MSAGVTIQFYLGVVDCHFEENYRIALRNFNAGRPLTEGFLAPTFIPPDNVAKSSPLGIGMSHGVPARTEP